MHRALLGGAQVRRQEAQRRLRDEAVARRQARQALRRAARVQEGHMVFPPSDNGLRTLHAPPAGPRRAPGGGHGGGAASTSMGGVGGTGGGGYGARQFTGRSGERLRLRALDEFRALREASGSIRAAGGGGIGGGHGGYGGRGGDGAPRVDSGLKVVRRVNSLYYTVADA